MTMPVGKTRLTVTTIRFRSMQADDLPRMQLWYNAPHILAWYSFRPHTLAEVQAKYVPYIRGDVPIRAFMIYFNESPIGFIQTYRIADYPEYQEQISAEPGAAGLDVFIGEAKYLHRGLGALIVRTFLRQVVFTQAWATCCLVDPFQRNQAALRAYAKAGFQTWGNCIDGETGEAEVLLRIGREQIMYETPAPGR